MSEIKVDFTKTVDVDWETEKEFWNEYRLKDGTLLKVKLVLRGVRRAIDQHQGDGSPLYALNTTAIVRALEVPKGLMVPPKIKTQGVT